MVKKIKDCPGVNNTREVTFEYDLNNKNDLVILKKINEVISEEQPLCTNCENFYYEGCLGGYEACACQVHGILEVLDNPHHDGDASKCEDYHRKSGNISNG